MAFGPEFLDEIRERVSLEAVIGRRVRLVRRGREQVALCPFHNERTPSFSVSDAKGFYHCFGCGAHGDVISFVRETEGLDFREAVERLAAEAGLEVPRDTPEERARAEAAHDLYGVLEAAAAWFEARLAGADGRAARDYLAGRGVGAEAARAFRLGFAPDSRGALKDALGRQGIAPEPMIGAGLLVAPEDGGDAYDRFRNRLMFPILDRRGRVVAFGGRALGEARAKYLNSPETAVFHKGRMLYNLSNARKAARESGALLVVEGYMDAIALAGAGFGHVVAPLGTALTEDQMHELWRLAPEPILCLDGDDAGARAALRAAERALPHLKPGHSLRFASLPKGEDPDSLLRKHGREAMARLIDRAAGLADLIWHGETRGRRFDTPERRAQLQTRLRALAGTVRDETVKEHYRRHFEERAARAFGTPERSRRRSATGPRRPLSPPRLAQAFGPALTASADELARRREEIVLLALLNHPEQCAEFLEPLGEARFRAPDLDRLRRAILEVAGAGADLDSEGLTRQLTERGFKDIIRRVAGRDVAVHAQFARADADPEVVASGLRHVLAREARDRLLIELREAEAEYAATLTADAEARFTALREAYLARGGDEAELGQTLGFGR